MGNKELNENELDNVVGGGSTIVDGSSDCWRCLTWIHYCDALDDNECRCYDFNSNDPVCCDCTHAKKSQKWIIR